jgi:hypothetical protein
VVSRDQHQDLIPVIILAFVAVMATLGCAPAGALGLAAAALAVFNAAARGRQSARGT